MKHLAHLLALNTISGLGPVRLKLLLDYFEDPKAIWEASPSVLKELRLPMSVIEKLQQTRTGLDPEMYLQEIEKNQIKVLTIFDEAYPRLLKEIHDFPLILYYKGDFSNADTRTLGVVGTRKVTGYGTATTKQFTKGLVEAGFTIVSGLARGVDTIAHKTALEAGGRTIAVLGGGLNKLYPPENTQLAESIWQGSGVVLSEFPPDTESFPGNFPARNRIISGLSLGVLVTEATEDSGSLITAKLALDQGREVFAVPGPITSSFSKGPANLIKSGARLVTEIPDILESLGMDASPVPKTLELDLSDNEKIILNCLQNGSKHIDELCRELKIVTSQLSATLVKLEILGVVKNLGGGQYAAIF